MKTKPFWFAESNSLIEISMRKRIILTGVLITAVLASPALSQSDKKIPASQAAEHVGETATICGYVASTRYLSNSRSKPTFLNFDKPYPNEDFTVVIWPEDRAKFGEPENRYLHKNICVTGEIVLYRGSPQIAVKALSQLREQ